MPNYPHVPAAFINAIAETGTKDEAVRYLQQQWNETCALREVNANMLTALQLLVIAYEKSAEHPSYVWGVPAYQNVRAAIAKATEKA